MFCRKCKKEIPEGSAFCCWCGTKQTAVRPPVKTRGNGTGTVYKRGKTWEIQVTLGFRYDAETGKLKRIARTKGGFKTKTDALNYVQTLKPNPSKNRFRYLPIIGKAILLTKWKSCRIINVCPIKSRGTS